jgi:pentatricopeptide repeat protein
MFCPKKAFRLIDTRSLKNRTLNLRSTIFACSIKPTFSVAWLQPNNTVHFFNSTTTTTLRPDHRFSFSTSTLISRSQGTTTNDYSQYQIDDEIDDPESIILLLKDTTAYPPGSMTSPEIKEAENALIYWASSSSSSSQQRQRRQRRKRKHNDNNYININEDEKKEYTNNFENAMFLLSRLALEQKMYEDYNIKNSGIGRAENNNTMHGYDDKIYDEHNNGDENFYYVRSFLINRVIDCWRIGWRDGRLDVTPNEIIAWVEDLDSNGVISDSRALTMIVDGICLRGDPFDAPLLAQWLLDRRLGQAYEDDTFRPPDTIFFTNVIRAWAKSGRIEAPEMADGILQLMHDLYLNSAWTESMPNAYTYAATMEAWSKSQRYPESIKRIDALLDEQKNSSLEQVAPDRVSYQYALNAWADSKSATGTKKAYGILQEMIALYEAGNDRVAPNASNFARVILALSRHGDNERVDSVLEQMQDLYSSTGDPRFQPTDECWKACIIAKAKTGRVTEAHGMLDELIERALLSNNRKLMPRRSYFVDILVAWSKVNDQIAAAEKSQRVLDRMINLGQDMSYRDLLPDSKSFEMVILTWSRSRHPSAPERIQNLLCEMERQFSLGNHKMKTSRNAYTNLIISWQRSGRKQNTDAIQQIFDTLQDRCIKGESHLRPDRYMFGILIDAWSRQGNVEKAELIFEQMIKEWKSGNSDARPDTHVFHTILKACSKNRIKSVERCDHYLDLMKATGVTKTVQACGYLIDALSIDEDANAEARANIILEELLQNINKGTVRLPPQKEYRQFLQTIAKSCITRRSQQANGILKTLPFGKIQVHRDLLPPLQ